MSEPNWMAEARRLIGTREVPGPESSASIMRWAARLGARALGMNYNADSIPWCGLFVAQVMSLARLPTPKIAVRAAAWAEYGSPCSPAPGAILVFQRPGGGHVGFFVGHDADSFHVLGGNQSDAVSITRVAKSRLVACRWPPTAAYRPGPVPPMTARSAPLSRNEA